MGLKRIHCEGKHEGLSCGIECGISLDTWIFAADSNNGSG